MTSCNQPRALNAEPELRLMLDMIDQARRDIERFCIVRDNCTKDDIANALTSLAWLLGESPTARITFKLACEALGLEAAHHRHLIVNRFHRSNPLWFRKLFDLTQQWIEYQAEQRRRRVHVLIFIQPV